MANILNILDKDTGKYVSIPAIQGASAYEVALKNGFKGSEEEWLASLKGSGADVDMSEYATIDYVDKALEEVTVDIDNVNLEGYATEEWTKDYINDNIEAISTGYYETVDIVGEDITDVIINANGELPTLPTYFGGTRYIVNNGIVNMMINPKVDSDSFYINDYVNSDINQKLVLTDSDDGNCSDYLIYGAYNKDLLTKTDLMRSSKSTINKYANLNTLDGYYPSVEYAQDGLGASYMTGWSFYGNTTNNEWCDVRIQRGSASQKVQEQIDKLLEESSSLTSISSKYTDGSPQAILYRRCPCVYFEVKPYTTYTINYTGDTEGEQNYMKGLHWRVLTDSPSGGGCWNGEFARKHSEGHAIGQYKKTITTGKDAKYLMIFVGRVKSCNTLIQDADFNLSANYTSDSAAVISSDITKYNIDHLSVVEGSQTYEYYVDMIKNIPFKLSITAMSVLDENKYEYYELDIPYVMASNQYFRFERQNEMYAVSRPLQKAVGMRLDEMNDTYMNYEAGHVGVIGKWIDSKDVYRLVLNLTLPKITGSTSSDSTGEQFVYTYASLPDVIDTLLDIKIIQQGYRSDTQATIDRFCYGSNYNGGYKNDLITAFVTTTTPIEGSVDFYSNLGIKYGASYQEDSFVFVIEYTRYELDDEGNVI
jgi:hypothetical protein